MANNLIKKINSKIERKIEISMPKTLFTKRGQLMLYSNKKAAPLEKTQKVCTLLHMMFSYRNTLKKRAICVTVPSHKKPCRDRVSISELLRFQSYTY